ncbi:MAG: RHS repeat-associated core domain-containing protein, partial [Candidatus Methylophosphatis roskildensis]
MHTTRLSPQAKAKRGKGAKADGPAQTTQTTTFEYDALGRRIAKVDTFGRTEFIWEGMRLIEERRGSHVVSYVYEPDSYVPLARIDASGNVTDAGGLGTTDDAPAPANDAAHGSEAGEPESERGNEPEAETETPSNLYYFHTDQVGLPEELTDAQGHIRWRAAYKAWGNTLAERWETVDLKGEAVAFVEGDGQPLIEQNLRYQGQYLDRDTGMHYNTFRYYDPDIGRFISPDPIGLLGGKNLYEYAPNPIAWIDPWGLSCAFDKGANRWRDTQTGRFAKRPTDPSQLVNNGRVNFADVDVWAKQGSLPNSWQPDPGRFPAGGYKYRSSDPSYNYQVHGHGTDPVAVANYPGGSSASPTSTVVVPEEENAFVVAREPHSVFTLKRRHCRARLVVGMDV